MGATKNISGNALVVKETKGIQAKSIDGFQKLEFWLPAGMTKDDTMLWLSSTSNTDLTGTDITAHLRGDETEKRLRLLICSIVVFLVSCADVLDSAKGARV